MEMELKNTEKMQKEIRSWGIWSLVLGGLHILGSGFLSAPWGIVLILVGLASFYFRTASMFIIYTVTLSGAALLNLIGGGSGWGAFAVVQIFLAISTFLEYRRYRHAEVGLAQQYTQEAKEISPEIESSARWFPWIGPLLGCSSILALAFAFFMGIALAITGGIDQVPNAVLSLPDNAAMGIGILGIGVCLASLLSGYKPKAASIIGLVAAGLTLAIEVAFYLLA